MLRIYLLVLLTSAAFGQDPLPGRGVNFYSLAKEAALGAQMAEQIRIEKKMLGSAVVDAYVAGIGRMLAAHLPEYAPGFRFQVFTGAGSLLGTPDALPGGYVFVPTGLLLAAEGEPEFAGMLVHSMAHAAARHGTRMATRGQILNLSSVPLVLMGGWAGFHASEAALAIPLGFPSFMRKHELEADRIAVQAMARAGYDPMALVRYIERMPVDSLEGSGARSPLPPREERISALRQHIAELPPVRVLGQRGRLRENSRGSPRRFAGSPSHAAPLDQANRHRDTQGNTCPEVIDPMQTISRRALARFASAAAVGGALRAQEPQSAEYIGPLTGVDKKAAGRVLDPLPYALRLVDSAPRQLRFSARNKSQAQKWQDRLRGKLAELVGGFPKERSPLRPMTLETRDFGRYRREKLIFDSQDGVSVLAYILLPTSAKTPLPAVICVPGHGRGVDDIVGIDEKGRDRTDKGGYQHDFAIQIVEAGMAAIAIEPMGFGCRRDPATAKRGLGRSSCQPVAGTALLLGQTMIGWRVYDVMRTVDLIATRPELDAERVACIGISGGGTCTVFSAALEPRIRAALVSGYLNTFRDSIGSIAHCIDNYVPGILNWAEMYDIAGLIAPRPLFVESGRMDDIFPVEASVDSFNKVRAVYEVFGAADRVEQEVFDKDHSFWGKRGIPFLARHLRV